MDSKIVGMDKMDIEIFDKHFLNSIMQTVNDVFQSASMYHGVAMCSRLISLH